MDRVAQHTRQPRYCVSFLKALGNDPFVIAECLARPLLAERLLSQSASEQAKQANPTYEQVAAATGDYSLPSISDDGDCTDVCGPTSTDNAPSARVRHSAIWTGSEMIIWGGYYADKTAAEDTLRAPTARQNQHGQRTQLNDPSHTAVWTGSEMIIWAEASPIKDRRET